MNPSNQTLDRLLYAALILCCGMTLSKGLADPDFWGHVQYGRDALVEGLPATAAYTYTAEGHRWINHENLAELAFAVGVDSIGPAGLLLLKCLAGMLALALLLKQAHRQNVGQVAMFTGAMLVAGNMMLFWTLRPQLFSFVYFVALLQLLEFAFHEWSPTQANWRRVAMRLAPIVPLFVLWTNTHGGFLAGLCVLVALLVLRGCECILAARRGDASNGWRHVGWAAVTFGGIAAATCLATLLNPYGWELHQWLLMSLGQPRPEIIEWRPPEWSIPWIPFWTLSFAVLASGFGTRRQRDWVQLAIVGLVLWQAVQHRRHVVFLSLLFGYWMLPHWDSLLKRIGIGRDESTLGESFQGGARKAFFAGAVATVMLLTYSLGSQLSQIPVRHDKYPVKAFQFMADQNLHGRLLVQLRWGQYALAAFGTHPGEPDQGRPTMKVAFDGRFRTCYPQSVVDRYFDFAEGVDSAYRNRSPHSPPPSETAILNQEPRPDFVLIDRECVNAAQVMSTQNDEWVLLYQDSIARLYGRREVCDSPDSQNFVPLAARTVSSLQQEEITPWPALPRHRVAAPVSHRE